MYSNLKNLCLLLAPSYCIATEPFEEKDYIPKEIKFFSRTNHKS